MPESPKPADETEREPPQVTNEATQDGPVGSLPRQPTSSPVPTPPPQPAHAASAQVTASPTPAPQPATTPKYERFNKVAGGIQSLVTAAGILVAGAWAIWRYTELFESQSALAALERAEAQAKSEKRLAQAKVVMHIEVSAQQVAPSTATGSVRWVVVELSLRNSGNEDYAMRLNEWTKFYIARAEGVSKTGEQTYGDRIHLQFDYPDKKLEVLNVKPSTEPDKYRTIQKVTCPGLYIIRFSTPTTGGPNSENREYNAQSFFYVK